LPDLRPFLSIGRTLALAFVGGAIAARLGLPAAWLSGAMIVVTAVSFLGVNTKMPQALFDGAILLLGIVLGAGVTPELVGHAGAWPLSLACLLLSVAIIQFAVQTFLMRVGKWDRPTAFFASLPGALSYVLASAAETKADIGKVVVGQSLRLFLLVAALPSVVVAAGHVAPATLPLTVASPGEIAILVVGGIVGGVLLRQLRFPGGLFAGSFIVSAVLHGGGWIAGTLPLPVVIAGFVVLGAFIGSRFSGTDIWFIRQIAAVSFGAFLVGLAIAGIFAVLVSRLTGMGFAQVMIAFAPGGIDSMTSLAVALHLDSAYVAVHQLARFVLIALSAPVVARSLFRRSDET
jgi:membrane AbrB-like protein